MDYYGLEDHRQYSITMYKTLTLIAVFLTGTMCCNVYADSVRSIQPITFSLSLGDGSELEDLVMDDAPEDTSQTTCAMTPGGTSTLVLLEEPITLTKLEEDGTETPIAVLQPINSLNTPLDSPRSIPYNPNPVPNEPEEPEDLPVTTMTPEPATLAIIGLGLGALGGWTLRGRRKCSECGAK